MSEVVQAIAKVMDEIGPIAKRRVNAGAGGSFDAFTVDDVMDHLRPLMAKHQLVCLPKLRSVEYVEGRTRNDAQTWTARVVYDFELVSGVDGSSLKIRYAAEGKDTQDKSATKAGRQAQKYALIELFLISTGETDPDVTELDGASPPRASSKGGRRAEATSVVSAPRPAWAGLTAIVAAGQNEDGSWTPLCPWCASDVLDQKGKKSKGGKDLPAWTCTNDLCGGGNPKNDGGHWPWASFDPHFFEVTGDIQDLIEEHVGGNPNEVTVKPPLQGPTLWLWESLAAVIKNEDERRTVIRAVMDKRGIERDDLTQEIANLVFTDAQHAWYEANPKEKPF